MTLLAFHDVTCVRGGRLLFEALDFSVAPGEAVQVTGPNGCGKSSLLRLAAGLLDPFAGRIELSASVALADESLALDREQTLGQALGWWSRLDANPPSLDTFGLQSLRDVPVRLLSTGQLRRARLARVVASRAALWLLDEPVNGLDSAGTALLGKAVERHLGDGGGVLAASHIALPGPWRTVTLA